jgi:hypothetical protein
LLGVDIGQEEYGSLPVFIATHPHHG